MTMTLSDRGNRTVIAIEFTRSEATQYKISI